MKTLTRFSYSHWLAMVLFACAVWLFYSAQYDARDGAHRAMEIRQQLIALRQDNARMVADINEMRTHIRDIKQNPDRLEEMARYQLNMITHGEIFVMIE